MAAKDVLADAVPFYSKEQFNSLAEAQEALTHPQKYDVLSIGVGDAETVYIHNGTEWVIERAYSGSGLPDGYEFKSPKDNRVVAVLHRDKPLEAITYGNNSKAGSEATVANRYHAGRVRLTDGGECIPFFLDVADRTLDGYPALGFRPLVSCDADSQKIFPTQNGESFLVNSYAGIVVFANPIDFSAGNGPTITFVEYTGKTLEGGGGAHGDGVELNTGAIAAKKAEEGDEEFAKYKHVALLSGAQLQLFSDLADVTTIEDATEELL